jgi:hypothetical protein
VREGDVGEGDRFALVGGSVGRWCGGHSTCEFSTMPYDNGLGRN